jgi:hypothetical protein
MAPVAHLRLVSAADIVKIWEYAVALLFSDRFAGALIAANTAKSGVERHRPTQY